MGSGVNREQESTDGGYRLIFKTAGDSGERWVLARGVHTQDQDFFPFFFYPVEIHDIKLGILMGTVQWYFILSLCCATITSF